MNGSILVCINLNNSFSKKDCLLYISLKIVKKFVRPLLVRQSGDEYPQKQQGQIQYKHLHANIPTRHRCDIDRIKLPTVFPRFSAPGRLLIQTVLGGALIRGGRLYEGGAYLKMLINGGAHICTRIKLRKK